ncbi:hypothetical protein QQ045_003125 [Rhodiola kirilowii]
MFPINFPASQTVAVDSALWKACAGSNVKVPEVGTMVYYFPEGHAEQCDLPPALAPPVWPIFPCRVDNVRYLADTVSDEVFAVLLLQPVGSNFRGAHALPSTTGVEQEGSRFDSCAKVLTRSDTADGKPLYLPVLVAPIFPPLNYEQNPTVQNLTIADVQGVDWVFEHSYRGRHLLTHSKGWSHFVHHKQLVSGDTVVFMRENLTGRLYIAIRRQSPHKGLSRRFVEEAVCHAEKGNPFEVIFYPRNGLYVVNIDRVDRALSLRWDVGMPVKMPIASDDDSSRSTWLRGQVSLVRYSLESGQWIGSPWKMLQVTWGETEHLQNVERVSPWQVEYAGPPAQLQPIHPPIIRVREPAKFGCLGLGYSMIFCFSLAVGSVYIMNKLV